MMMTLTIDDILSDFDLFDDWDERYRYLIDLGRRLAPLPESARTDAHKVRGCASQVWLDTRQARGNDGKMRLFFKGDSDAHIVKGLVALILALFDGKTAPEILATNAEDVFGKLQLAQHLSAQRANGVRSVVERIKAEARATAT
ncbi:Cysteine desulfuration protein SufE [Rhizobiales bacterium GAS113]|nr:Cysteine desulfuration protein SufE [Rhizobiales bacterium GAS113]